MKDEKQPFNYRDKSVTLFNLKKAVVPTRYIVTWQLVDLLQLSLTHVKVRNLSNT